MIDKAASLLHLHSALTYHPVQHHIIQNAYVYSPPIYDYRPPQAEIYSYFGPQTPAYAGYKWHTNDGTFKTNYVSSDPKFWTTYSHGVFYTPFFNAKYGTY